MQEFVKLRHYNCENAKCHLCYDDHLALGKQLDELCNTGNEIDHLGKIHLWMSKKGITPETEWGWATPSTFLPSNVKAYVRAYKRGLN